MDLLTAFFFCNLGGESSIHLKWVIKFCNFFFVKTAGPRFSGAHSKILLQDFRNKVCWWRSLRNITPLVTSSAGLCSMFSTAVFWVCVLHCMPHVSIQNLCLCILELCYVKQRFEMYEIVFTLWSNRGVFTIMFQNYIDNQGQPSFFDGLSFLNLIWTAVSLEAIFVCVVFICMLQKWQWLVRATSKICCKCIKQVEDAKNVAKM